MGYVGFKSGMSAELIKLVGLVAGFFVSFKYYQGWADALTKSTGINPGWAGAGVMIFVTVLVYFALTRLLRFTEKLVQVTFAKQLNSAGGLVMGVGRGILVASVVLVVLLQIPAEPMQESILEHSWSGKALSRAAPLVYDTLAVLPARLIGAQSDAPG